MNGFLQLQRICFAHGALPVVRDAELSVAAGEVLVIVGPSGCGKTTLLRLIAGLERPSDGSIQLDGRLLNDARVFVPPEQRAVGMVFQGLALFPHLTVARNVGFGLSKLTKAERERRVTEELRSVGLDGLGERYPHQLSGGQQQRVAVARSLIMRPKLLLMDEPFSDLDAATRSEVRAEVLRIIRAHGVTAIIVSHDREDAFHLADRIAEMEAGRIVRIGPAEDFRRVWAAHPYAP